MTEDKISVAVTGLAWMGNGIRSINSVLEEALEKAKEEVQIIAYQITEGSGEFLDLMSFCLQRGLRVSLVINRLYEQPVTVRKRLIKLASQFSHFKIFDFCPESKEALHAKVIVIDRTTAIVGSSNITRNGLILNHELGIVIEGPTANKISGLIDTLEKDSRTRMIASAGLP
jgi:phosphatidylserine/phosphatidylglycerophosphate/cardiolipin synthase-like enzyme